jgi:hypothetical protein
MSCYSFVEVKTIANVTCVHLEFSNLHVYLSKKPVLNAISRFTSYNLKDTKKQGITFPCHLTSPELPLRRRQSSLCGAPNFLT